MSDMKGRTYDQRIDDALYALTAAEPRPGMEQRLLAALRDAENRAIAPERGLWVCRPAVPVAAGFALVIAGVMCWHGRSTRTMPAHSQAALNPPVSAQRIGKVELHHDEPSSAQKSFSGGQRRRNARSAGVLRVSAQADTISNSESFPAPPLPLTEQERLLLRLVHRNDPLQLAELTAGAREAALQRERDETDVFFAPLPPLEGQQ